MHTLPLGSRMLGLRPMSKINSAHAVCAHFPTAHRISRQQACTHGENAPTLYIISLYDVNGGFDGCRGWGVPSDLCKKRQIACIGAMRRYSRICVCAFARPRTRLCDESPDGDLALPCPRHAQASPASRPRHRQPCGFHRIADHERRLRGTRMSTNRFTKPTALLSLCSAANSATALISTMIFP